MPLATCLASEPRQGAVTRNGGTAAALGSDLPASEAGESRGQADEVAGDEERAERHEKGGRPERDDAPVTAERPHEPERPREAEAEEEEGHAEPERVDGEENGAPRRARLPGREGEDGRERRADAGGPTDGEGDPGEACGREAPPARGDVEPALGREDARQRRLRSWSQHLAEAHSLGRLPAASGISTGRRFPAAAFTPSEKVG